MKPLEVAARFAAFTWYTTSRQAKKLTTQAEARRFSNQNWQIFLPVTQEGLGRLLLRVAKVRPNSKHLPVALSRPRKPRLATVR